MNQFKEFLKLVKNKGSSQKHVVDISHHRQSKSKAKKSNVVDISHHHSKKVVKEDFDKDFTYDHEHYGEDFGTEEHMEKTHARNLSHEHHDAVNGYVCGGLDHGHETGSYEVNHYLLRQHRKGAEVPKNHTFSYKNEDGEETHKVNISHLDDAIAQNKHEHGLMTYSGLRFNPKDHMNEHGELHMPAYTSSSTRLDIAKGYSEQGGKHILRIHHPAGSTGLYMGNNEDLTPFGQHEHLAPRGMTIRVHSNPTVTKSGHTIWHADRITS